MRETPPLHKLPAIYGHLADIIGGELSLKVYEKLAEAGRTVCIPLPYYGDGGEQKINGKKTRVQILREVIGAEAYAKLDDEWWMSAVIRLPAREVLRKSRGRGRK